MALTELIKTGTSLDGIFNDPQANNYEKFSLVGGGDILSIILEALPVSL